MRRSLVNLMAVAALLPVATAAMAFDPDTPAGAPEAEAFPITLDSDADPTIVTAFFAAFGVRYEPGVATALVISKDGLDYRFRPVALRLLDDNRAALLSVGEASEVAQASSGINAIHYLKSSPKGWVRDGEWFGLGSVGVMGNAATSWRFTDLIGKNPYLVTAGGGVWQGCMVSNAVLTELTPAGPVDRGNFTDAMSFGAGIGQEDAEYDGKIVAAKPDRSFTVEYSGTKRLMQTYVLKNGKYGLVGKDKIPGC